MVLIVLADLLGAVAADLHGLVVLDELVQILLGSHADEPSLGPSCPRT
ncbi:MAG: hypothetical protein R3F14_29640 [Polyangiaceae bacterium]